MTPPGDKRDFDPDPQISEADEREAEYRDEARRGYWDLPEHFDTPSPGGFGWAPNPYPGGSLI